MFSKIRLHEVPDFIKLDLLKNGARVGNSVQDSNGNLVRAILLKWEAS